MTSTCVTLRELSERFGLAVQGDADVTVDGVCNLAPGIPGKISFLSNPKLRAQLSATHAAAVILRQADADKAPVPALIAADPYLAYARIAAVFDPDRDFEPGVHPRACVDPSARIGAGCHVGPGAVIEAGASVGAGCFVGPNSVIGREAVIGDGCRLVANVFIGARVRVGARCQFNPGCVVGGRGFGNAHGPEGWESVPQLGSVRIGDDVEIGANTCIDRGAIDDTIIENGARLDNLIQIAHNCVIGEHTAIAAATGIAGSTRIGRRCMIGGAVGITGHIEVADDVVLLGRAMVTGAITKPGVYGSGLPLDEAREWRRTVARVKRLGRLEQRVKEIEHRLSGGETDHNEDPLDDV
ncbi:MAG: UDP-3-O-(3-hydroxymyristoyl)glucosamine N-acyltransferase [Nevskiales bacterium]|nr:UDP-3-O-(3-hydroxymyristoyl)glucosamine N-acyltransferase [Nevskiales bacterium]